jgi:dienelactone hydrolase
MRSIAVFLVLACWLTPVRAADDLTVLPAQSDGVTPRKMLSQYLEAQAKKHFDTRRAEVAKLQTLAEVLQRGRQLRERFVKALGGFPERTPLNARTVGTLSGDGYHIDKVIYESRTGHHVTANLYLPAGPGPFPAVLMPIGHSANGKAADYVQRGCILLAKSGLAALAYDPIGQGERSQLLDAQGKPAFAGSTNEHTALGVGALLVGRNTASYRVWDGIRSLDYLASRPDIDAKRLGCTGCSGGGTLTSYLMALDDRIVAAAPSCYLTSLERLFATIGPQDAEQNITGQVAFGMEHADYLTMHLPRPTLICAASRDFFDIQGTWTTFREAKLLYGLAGHAERVDLAEFNTTHGYPKPQREAVVRWMRRWLLSKDDASVEEDFAIRKDAELACTRTGQVLEDLKGTSAFDLNAARERELAAQRVKFQKAHSPEELLREVRRRIGLAETIAPATKRPVGQIKREGVVIDKLVFETEPCIRVPALEFKPADKDVSGLPCLLAVSGDGKAKDAALGGAFEQQAKAGRRVLALDLRGMGETAPNPTPANRRNYHGGDTKEAFLALHLDRPLLGQRTYDLLAVCRCLREEGIKELEVVGEGTAVPIVLHAAVLDPSLVRVRLNHPAVASWSEVVRQPLAENQLTNVVPGALEVYDLPDLVRLLGPRLGTVPAVKD